MKAKYTKESLVKSLVDFKDKLGRVPIRTDIDGANQGRYRKVFGGFTAALKAAGLIPNRDKPTKEEIITQLRTLAGILGKTPSFREFNEASKKGTVTIGTTYLTEKFGNFNTALEAAGLPINRVFSYEEKVLLRQLMQLYELRGNRLNYDAIVSASKDKKAANVKTFQKYFGTMKSLKKRVAEVLFRKIAEGNGLTQSSLLDLLKQSQQSSQSKPASVPAKTEIRAAPGHYLSRAASLPQSSFSMETGNLVVISLAQERSGQKYLAEITGENPVEILIEGKGSFGWIDFVINLEETRILQRGGADLKKLLTDAEAQEKPYVTSVQKLHQQFGNLVWFLKKST